MLVSVFITILLTFLGYVRFSNARERQREHVVWWWSCPQCVGSCIAFVSARAIDARSLSQHDESLGCAAVMVLR